MRIPSSLFIPRRDALQLLQHAGGETLVKWRTRQPWAPRDRRDSAMTRRAGGYRASELELRGTKGVSPWPSSEKRRLAEPSLMDSPRGTGRGWARTPSFLKFRRRLPQSLREWAPT